jgi:hypothetical protein
MTKVVLATLPKMLDSPGVYVRPDADMRSASRQDTLKHRVMG